MPEGYRGYIFSRPFLGERAPQHIQNLAIRDYARKNGLAYKLSATEYAMPGCHMMLEQIMGEELPSLKGIICYSIFQLPADPADRARIYGRVVAAGAELHGALEELVVRDEPSARRVEDIWRVRQAMAMSPAGEAVAAAWRIRCETLALRPAGPSDCEIIWAWRNHSTSRPMFENDGEISLESHRRWYRENAVPDRNAIYVTECAGAPVGYVRFALASGSAASATEADVSFAVDPAWRGRGIGAAMLAIACERFFVDYPRADSLTTSIAARNLRALGAFRAHGFSETSGKERVHFRLARRA